MINSSERRMCTDQRGVVDGGHRSGAPLLPAAERQHVVELHDAVVVLAPPPLGLPLVEHLPATYARTQQQGHL